MKVRVISAFFDKYTGELHNIGDVIEIGAKRKLELDEAGVFVECVPKEVKKNKEV